MFSHTLHSMHTCAVVDYFHHPYPPPPPLSPSLSLSVSLSLSPLQRPLHCSLGDASGQSFNEQMSSSLLSLPACPPCSSCFFHDPSSPLPGPSHRKLIGYRVLNGDLSDGLGHGSHVAGSLAGHCECQGEGEERGSAGAHMPSSSPSSSSYSSSSSPPSSYPSCLSRFNGMAPSARLFVTDMGVGAEPLLHPPQDLAQPYYGWARQGGQRVKAWRAHKRFSISVPLSLSCCLFLALCLFCS